MRLNVRAAVSGYMLHALIALMLLATPALAWETRSGKVCELTHKDELSRIRITYDLAISEYAIAITLNRTWAPKPVFGIRFEGQRSMTISTNRHLLSADRKTLTVKDRGFGNVLNGIEFNDTATAVLGDQAVIVTLDGAGPAVRAFRACASGLGV
ncbi:MAG: excinuclease ABC subunit B [Alphaproteobacteria bacterium]